MPKEILPRTLPGTRIAFYTLEDLAEFTGYSERTLRDKRLEFWPGAKSKGSKITFLKNEAEDFLEWLLSSSSGEAPSSGISVAPLPMVDASSKVRKLAEKVRQKKLARA